MITWLLGLLPAPIKYTIIGVGVIAYLVALIKPGSAISTICMAVATITGAASLFSAAKESIKAADKLKQAVKASEPEKPATPPEPTDPNIQGHSQESAEQYQGGIFNP